METYDFELLYFADPRFSGGTSTSVVNELTALRRAGICPGFCPVLSATFCGPQIFHNELEQIMHSDQVCLVAQNHDVTARIGLVHHPRLFEEMPAKRVNITLDKLILVLHHPPFNGAGEAEYDLARIIQNLREIFCVPVLIAPVGPAVRGQLEGQLPKGAELLEDDWHNLLDFKAWKFRKEPAGNDQIVIGRHSRPQLSKWPDTREQAVQVYPEKLGFRIRMLGASPELAEHFDPVPANWELLKYDHTDVAVFLQGLDFYVYYHAHIWIEAFGYSILEAIAAGVPVILPDCFKPLFGPAAIYADPDKVEGVIDTLSGDRAAYLRHVKQARQYVESRFSTEQFVPRLKKAGMQTPVRKPASPKAARRVLMMTSNGVGLGHITRAMAIMEWFPAGTKSALFTLSQGFKLAVEKGILTQFVPFHRLTGADVGNWNAALAEELNDFIAFFRPDTLVFDGNVPYSGLIAALDNRPDIKRVWMRRALWAEGGLNPQNHARNFDMILQPEEFSGRFDAGPTQDCTDGVTVVPPILNIAPAARLTRKEAREYLGVEPGKTAIGLMLGAGSNFEFSHIRDLIVNWLAKQENVDVIEIVPPIRNTDLENENGNCRRRELYPAYLYSRGFDAMITSAGYNTFHENLLGAVPTLFVPNEAGEMDRQILRARHASIIGCAEMLRASDRIGIDEPLSRLLNPDIRAQMQQRMAQFEFGDGATVAANLITQLSYALRANTRL